MSQVVPEALTGFLVGLLIGLTSVSGGVLLLPILIFVMKVPATVAVGSDAVIQFFTKIGAGGIHATRGGVNWRVVAALAAGSVPGSFGGVFLLSYLRSAYGVTGVSRVVTTIVGVLLIVIPVWLLVQRRLEEREGSELSTFTSLLGVSAVGLLAGLLVGMTSVGSGSIVLMLLFVFYRFAPRVMVGTDIVHAVVLTGVTSVLQFRIGNVDTRLVASLLVGSIPGALVGSLLSRRVPAGWLRPALCVVLLAVGVRTLLP